MNQKIDNILEDYIVDYVRESEKNLAKGEAPIMPLTFTLWRQIALKRLRKVLERESQNDYN